MSRKHKLLRLLVRERSAPVRNTIECLKGSDNRAMCTLRNLEKKNYVKKTIVERRPDSTVSLRYACRHSAYLRGISYTTSGDGLMIDYFGEIQI
ncbi:hypothetical protein Y032_0012g1901 [Ancylostoma ceylanicum]|uniref:Uncharacterized protein n=1 Tax=Ancylostoma ceylanicum TaxID=53326 RepID=A0A016VDE9_9BILA|nr:hypothetical protein Y032_0012g1901 [Ancylostoma ceylanicum]